jgi:hypothetical protein
MLRVNRPARSGRRFGSRPGPVGATRLLFFLRVSRMIICVAIASIAVVASGSAGRSDAVVLDVRRYPIFAGRYSVFARFQDALQRTLSACNKSEPVVVPAGEVSHGKIGGETLRGIQSALDCAALRDVLRQSAAKDGVLTQAVWRAVMGEPLPTPEDRAHALIMSFEATDFGEKPEWNFCQDNHRAKGAQLNPKASGFICYNATDPCSFLTWGPRGATAGAGREIQWILWTAWKQDPSLVQKAFGREYGNLQRLLRLKGPQGRTCNGDTPLEYFMCALWIDPARRQIWDDALVELGHSHLVREAYAKVYALNEFDGGKLLAFFALWNELGLTPTEVDYAFFLDRATHLGGPPKADHLNIGRLRACAREQPKALFANAAARRCLAELQPHDTQPEYRLARDVAFYLDAYPESALSEKEIAAWAGYVPLSAVHNFGLSETTPVQIPTPAPLSSLGPDLPKADSTRVTQDERQACPANVLAPLRQKPAE